MQRLSCIVVAVVYSLLLELTSVQAGTTTDKVKICGGNLSKAMSVVCNSFNSPNWDKSGASSKNRVKRDYGISDRCCSEAGCTWFDLRQYCAEDLTPNDVPEEEPTSMPELNESMSSDSHQIYHRSVEAEDEGASFRGLFRSSKSEVGEVHRRMCVRCWCRRRRRAGRRHSSDCKSTRCPSQCSGRGNSLSSTRKGARTIRQVVS